MVKITKEQIKQIVREELQKEAPIGDFETVGDFSKRLSFANPVDRKLLTSPKAQMKIKKIWENTPITFNMFFVNTQDAKSHYEIGVVSKETATRLFGPEITDKIDPNACTIIYTNNRGDERVMATGWILAHRLGHAISATDRFAGKKIAPELVRSWNEYTNRLRTLFVDILNQVYDIILPDEIGHWTSEDPRNRDILKLAAQQLGTMKSARDSNLRSWYEFAYEVFAQYLLTGKVKLNKLPDQLVIKQLPFGRKRIRGAMFAGHQKMYNNHDLEYYEGELESMLSNLIQELKGKIFVM